LPIVGLAASAAIGLLVDRVAQGIKQEATRYKASYSARQRSNLYIFDNTQVRWKFSEIRLVRYQGTPKHPVGKADCQDWKTQVPEGVVKASEVKIKLQPSENNKALELIPTEITLHRTKAKVRSVRWYVPWSWWMLLDDTSGQVDLNIKISISVLS